MLTAYRYFCNVKEITLFYYVFCAEPCDCPRLFRFPRAGTPNAKSCLKLATFRLSEGLLVRDIHCLELHSPLSQAFPWMEYIVRFGWAPNLKR